MNGNRRKFGRQSGSAIVDTVVATPVFLLLMLASAEVTNAFVAHNTLTKAVRAGARYVADNAIIGTTGVVILTPELIAETKNLVVYGNTAGTGSPVLPGLTVADIQLVDQGSDNLAINATFGYTGILGGSMPAFGFGGDVGLNHSLQATVVMRAL